MQDQTPPPADTNIQQINADVVRPTPGRPPTVSLKARSHPLEMWNQLPTEQRAQILAELVNVTLEFLARDVCVYFEGFGILIPHIESQQRVRTQANQIFIQTETFRSLRFEKCGELVAFHREKFGTIAELKDLIEQVRRKLPTSTKNADRELRQLLRGLFQSLKIDVVSRGFSNLMPQIGEFFALHNRQGSAVSDWFAGSDIFIRPKYRQTLFVEPTKMMERPILQSSWELLEAAYGAPACVLELDLLEQLTELGYDAEALQTGLADKDRRIPVGVFLRLEAPQALIYCTDGLRRMAAQAGHIRAGTELVFQLGLSSHDDQAAIPDWPLRPLSLGWVLMQSARSKSLGIGAGLSCDSSLIPDEDSELRCILATPFAAVKTEQLSSEGAFNYVNLIGICPDEAEVAASHSVDYLFKLLEYKELDQCTKPSRSSIVARTYFHLLEPSTEVSGPAQEASDT